LVALSDRLVRPRRPGHRGRRLLRDVAVAYRHADVVLVEATTPAAAGGADPAGPTAPALQARNHAATPPARP